MEAKDSNFSPQDSFSLINRIIDEARYRYEENGTIISLWGAAVIISGIGQFLLIMNGLAAKSGLIWLLMIPMFIYTIYRGFKDHKSRAKSPHTANDISSFVWFMAGMMAMSTGFIFSSKFGNAMVTVIYLPFCIAALVSALTLKKTFFVWLSILAVFIAYGALYIPYIYHPLISALIAGVLFLIPGLILRSDYNKRKHV